jgi:transposase-like protein
MWIMARRSKFSREVRERAVALVFEQVGEYGSQWEAICSVAAKVGVSSETLRKWVRQAEVDAGARSRLIVGWSIDDNIRKELVIDALGMAIVRRRPENQPDDARTIAHSDHGPQYIS